MKRTAVLVIALAAAAGCSKSKEASPPAEGSQKPKASATAARRYFELTVDGRPFSIDAADVSSTFREVGDHKELKILAGKDGGVAVTLTAIGPMTGPSSTPSGSPEAASGIVQGSVSLQDFPEKGYTTNSFDTTSPETSAVVPDAVVITAIEPDGADAKLVTGTFRAKTFRTRGSTDPKDTDHTVVGAFRIRHEFTAMSGDRF